MARSERSRRHLLAASLVVAFPAVVACNSIIGLNDFEKTQCPGARCVDEGGLSDQLVEGSTSDGGPDAPIDAKGADPVSWAKWPMPNYVDGGGGGGQPLSSPPLRPGAGIVTDTVTNLVWSSTLAAGDWTATQAEAQCQKLTNGPWRAPKRIELVTLIDYSRTNILVDTNAFKDLKNFKVWSTSKVRPVTDKSDQAYWVVNFETGAVEPLRGDLAAKVLCVRAK
jgi:hypothetical protein